MNQMDLNGLWKLYSNTVWQDEIDEEVEVTPVEKRWMESHARWRARALMAEGKVSEARQTIDEQLTIEPGNTAVEPLEVVRRLRRELEEANAMIAKLRSTQVGAAGGEGLQEARLAAAEVAITNLRREVAALKQESRRGAQGTDG